MKTTFKALLLLAMITSCQNQQKIGFIDNGDVINEYQMKIDIEEKYKVKDEDFKKKMDSMSRNFQVEAQAFQMTQSKMSQKKAQEKYNELSQKQQVLQQQFQMEQQVIEQAFRKELDSVLNVVKDFVSDYGKTNGYTYILGKNEAGSVMYGNETDNLTEVIIDALNTAYESEDSKEEK